MSNPALLVGYDSSDDAAVYRVSDEVAVIETVDFFTPIVDDPYLFGQIAAANALSDVYAMGGEPKLAMNLLCVPNCLPKEDIRAILEGGHAKAVEAGCVIAGGHTIQDNEPKYGLCVTGFVHPDHILKNVGAQPGDVLVVDIYEIDVADEGTVATDDHCGPLFEGTDYRTKKIKIEDGMADFNGVKFPIDPMVGVIGTAPDGDDVIDGFVGAHGGNMDNKLITRGARLYFPVRVPGALLQMGDVHAAMGDGELCGTGIEIPAEITAKVQLVKGFELHWPVLETKDKWYVNACAPKYDEALMNGAKEMQRLLMAVTGWDAVETYMYMSVRSDVEISQGCEPCDCLLYTSPSPRD